MFQPRPKQKEVLAYQRGYMGVAAVPGSGKTTTLSWLAAKLLSETDLAEGQEILIVTLVNSAAANFARQVNEYVKADGLLPGYGYRVRTLHGLANDIVRQKPTAAGLDEAFSIIDERESREILDSAVEAWIQKNPAAADSYLTAQHVDNQYYRTHHWRRAIIETAGVFIRQAKDDLLAPGELQAVLDRHPDELLLAQMCVDIYRDYERALAYRGAVDFQDLICRALQVLRRDADYLAALQHKWVYILEDEAQDSSQLQERILRLLAGEGGNWVRVGDPNQAIFETFTTADPKHLRDFIAAKTVIGRELPNSGRSTRSIQRLANYLINWTLSHPHHAIRSRTPLTAPYIQPTPKGDPQPNPADRPDGLVLYPESCTPAQEAALIVESCRQWLSEHPDETAAILVPRNHRGSEMVKLLRQKEVPYVENLNSTSSVRAVVGSLTRVLLYLADPKDAGRLAALYRVWKRDERDDEEAALIIKEMVKMLRHIRHVEDYLAPRLWDWLEETDAAAEDNALYRQLTDFRERAGHWLRAAGLPIDQLILTIAGDVFTNVGDLATAYMVALHLSRLGETHPTMRLPEFAAELHDIASNKRKFVGLSDDDSQFDPDAHRGKVTVTTLHKAKGLEWDRVYLPSVNNYDFPSGSSHDNFIGEKWFIRDELNLSAEALAQLRALRESKPYREGFASAAARIDYVAERLRLLYVGITRARKELIVTWNTGRRGDATEATPLLALRTFWERELAQ